MRDVSECSFVHRAMPVENCHALIERRENKKIMTRTKGTINISSSTWLKKLPKLQSRHNAYGYDFDASMNMRKHARKETRLQGVCSHGEPADFENDTLKGRAADIIVNNISRSGIAFTLSVPFNAAVGDILNVSFTLDTKNRTVANKKVIVRRAVNDVIAAEFKPHIGGRDTALAVYLLP
jgi:hypothetical protein